jgi:carbonic anhydrase/acetyltransferase-like protein (isoleucine patch superfamily)
MPGVTIGGNCNIGAHTLIGSGSIIYQGTRIGENCKIGMGTLITNNLKNNSVVVDQPRKIVRNVE